MELLKPMDGEDDKTFLDRFMADPDMIAQLPDGPERLGFAGGQLWEHNHDDDEDQGDDDDGGGLVPFVSAFMGDSEMKERYPDSHHRYHMACCAYADHANKLQAASDHKPWET